MEWLHWLAIGVVAFCAIGRSLGILAAKLRQRAYRKRAADYPSSWRDRCASPEPPLLLATTLILLGTHVAPADPALRSILVSGVGALLSLLGIGLMLWAVASFPSVSPGHYILPEHRIVRRGPYGRVRHPLYLAAFLIWLGLTIAFRSVPALAISVLYVIPAYCIYLRSEEAMMIGHFGDAYRAYASEVGRFWPRRTISRP